MLSSESQRALGLEGQWQMGTDTPSCPRIGHSRGTMLSAPSPYSQNPEILPSPKPRHSRVGRGRVSHQDGVAKQTSTRGCGGRRVPLARLKPRLPQELSSSSSGGGRQSPGGTPQPPVSLPTGEGKGPRVPSRHVGADVGATVAP